jgi:thiamine-phosphate pyrophosphorylase
LQVPLPARFWFLVASAQRGRDSMSDDACRLVLITPVLADDEPAFLPGLAAALAAGDVAAVIVPLAPADERTLTRRLKLVSPVVQEAEAAMIATLAPGEAVSEDFVATALKGGADGIQIDVSTPEALAGLGALRQRLGRNGSLGVADLRTRHAAMEAGEAGADYVMFGEMRPDSAGGAPWRPSLDKVLERAGWWAPIFATPCVAVAPDLDAVTALAETGAEFVGLESLPWEDPAAVTVAVGEAMAAMARAQRPAA